ncbi:MAG TPA: E3 binding domain-containing protein [Gemmatimonadota bacterium]|nr:E3 binding domain-containing protein [Gemmatimonadota bacterium]
MSKRIYKSAQKVIDAYGADAIDLDAIEGTGKDGAITKADVEAFLADPPKDAKTPTAQDIIRAGLARGHDNATIEAAVLEVHPDSKIRDHGAGWVGWTIGNERRKNSDWWQKHGPKVVEDRDVKAEA